MTGVQTCALPIWDGFEAVRQWRGAEYRITVTNPAHVEKGVKRILADGETVDRIPVYTQGTHRIEVEMG